MGVTLWLMLAVLVASVAYIASSSAGRKRRRGLPLPPGPKGYPILGNLPQLGQKPHQTLHALSKEYGPLFRLRFGFVDVVVAASADVAAQFLRAQDANFCNRPPNSGAEHIAYNYQDLVFAPYGPRWRALRKLCALHLFSTKALDDLRPIREGEVAVMVRDMAGGRPSSAAVDLGQATNKCATNALARATVGRRVFAEGEEAREFKEMVVELMQLAGVFNVGDFVPGLGLLDPQGVVGKMKSLHKRCDTFFDGLIREARAGKKVGGGGDGKDLLSVLLKQMEEQQQKKTAVLQDGEDTTVTETDIKALLLNLFTAGTDTSSSTTEWAVAELIRHPEIMKQAHDELDAVVGRSRLVSETDLPNLPVLQAIIKETFRLHPSTPLSLPRIAADDCEVAGHFIPKDATLLVNVWAISRDPAKWPQPLEFRPARFLPGGSHENVDVKGNDFEIIPFGAGRRICAGMSLGLRMVQFMTATLVHAFDLRLPEGLSPEKLDMEEAYGLTLQRAVPLVVHPVPRLLPAAYAAGGH